MVSGFLWWVSGLPGRSCGWWELPSFSLPNTSPRGNSLGRAAAGRGLSAVTELPRGHKRPRRTPRGSLPPPEHRGVRGGAGGQGTSSRVQLSSAPLTCQAGCTGPAGVPLPTSPGGFHPSLWDSYGVWPGPSFALNLGGSTVTGTGDLPVLPSKICTCFHINHINSGEVTT